jgi:hypothetical protein
MTRKLPLIMVFMLFCISVNFSRDNNIIANIALFQFENKSSYKGDWDIEKGFTNIIIDKLHKLKKYRIIRLDKKDMTKLNRKLTKFNKRKLDKKTAH